MFRWALPCFLVVLLSGCATPPNLGWQSRYSGVPWTDSSPEWGAPVSKHKIYDGTMAYLWYTGRNSAYRPRPHRFRADRQYRLVEGLLAQKYMTNLECGVRIYTWPDGTIRDVLLKEANKQWWESLHCREVFGGPRRPAY